MERKIGEIFNIDNEWYQVVKSNSECCKGCAFYEKGCKAKYADVGSCGTSREDWAQVIFKKLEKVGEPYTTFVDKTVQNYLLETAVSVPPKDVFTLINNEQRLIAIEIEQNKEDMEERKLNLKPFDIQKAREGKPVCTRDGRKARIICFDFRDVEEICCLIAVVDYGEAEKIYYYDSCGKYRGGDSSKYDLMMLPEKKERWVNVYHNGKGEYWSEQVLFSTKKEAIDFVHDHAQYVTTVKIDWEE